MTVERCDPDTFNGVYANHVTVRRLKPCFMKGSKTGFTEDGMLLLVEDPDNPDTPSVSVFLADDILNDLTVVYNEHRVQNGLYHIYLVSKTGVTVTLLDQSLLGPAEKYIEFIESLWSASEDGFLTTSAFDSVLSHWEGSEVFAMKINDDSVKFHYTSIWEQVTE